MKSLFDEAGRNDIVGRLTALEAGSIRQWGKMSCAQMLCHCAVPLECGTGDRPSRQSFLGKIITPLIRGSVLGEKPFKRNSPTDPTFVVSDERDFAAERARLLGLVQRFVDAGPTAASTYPHPFFGKLSGEQWGVLMYKHLDHHLRQFGR
jgi:Protein of unknown function (DUF1569)